MSAISEVGCRRCGQGGNWACFTDGERIVKLKCTQCEHDVECKLDVELKKEPDQKGIDLRMFL